MSAQPLQSRTGPLPQLTELRTSIDRILCDFFTAQQTGTALPALVTGLLRDFVMDGGKRVRPLMCAVGYLAAAGSWPPPPVLRAAASLEIFHAFALIHDDIMDDSETRRGRPALHRMLAARSQAPRAEQAARDGLSQAILLGDLALVWSDAMLHTCGLAPSTLAAVRPLLDVMRTELMAGQYLDLTATGTPQDGIDRALDIIRYKTAKYTIERPLHLGAGLARGPASPSSELLAALSAFALPLGDAFQLRDDLLGAFGDPEETGKSRLNDFREGKQTVLLGLAVQHADPADRARLQHLVGDPHLTETDATTIRAILTATGARQRVEDMITRRLEQALIAIEDPAIAPPARTWLHHLATTATHRTS